MPPSPQVDAKDAIVQIILSGFINYSTTFAAITQRARQRFEQRNWKGMRRDTLERLDLYTNVVTHTTRQIRNLGGVKSHPFPLWDEVKATYRRQIAGRCDAELACTFYNSIARKLWDTIGFEPRLAFAQSPPLPDSPNELASLLYTLSEERITGDTISKLLTHYGFQVPFRHLEEDTENCARRIQRLIGTGATPKGPIRIEMIKAPFFRGMSTYLVGRISWANSQRPLVIAMDNSAGGLAIDALLCKPDELRILFSFSRAYFHVICTCPSVLVNFLRSLMPQKRMAEIYIGLGFNKHGKTELYRDLLAHQKVCGLDRFDFSPGKRGMVMVAFNMPQNDLIYKLIRDRFDSPKSTTARKVMQKYDYVFRHDRAGRLLDVQTFENLELETCCFTPELLSEIGTETRTAATIDGDRVLLHHAYVKRLVTPLDIYLQQADAEDARRAVIDYGRAIKDLARVNVFPGDLLIKNFGVTSLGRVVFYDYDELCKLTDCRFRKLPQARRYEDEMAAEPWFMVGENDVFPEEFGTFLGFSPELTEVFRQHHGDLLQPDFWRAAQEQILSGVWKHIRPYGSSSRLRPTSSNNGNG